MFIGFFKKCFTFFYCIMSTSLQILPSTQWYLQTGCIIIATVYGNGVYFAEELSYSAQDLYSRPDSNGHKRVYLCKVLVGEFTQGRPGLIDPPSKFGQHEKHILCDSVVDDINNPNICVIFKDSQAYPEYLIEFKFIWNEFEKH